jgi:hypothetical protein
MMILEGNILEKQKMSLWNIMAKVVGAGQVVNES